MKAGDGASGDAIVEANNVKVPGGANITVVAHLDEAGDPALTPFVNDVSKIPAGKARITVRHTAAAPGVDVRAGGEPVFTDLSNPDEDSAEVGAGTIKADVVLAGTDTVATGRSSLVRVRAEAWLRKGSQPGRLPYSGRLPGWLLGALLQLRSRLQEVTAWSI